MPISESEVISSGLALECFFAMSDLAMSILGGRWYNNTSKALLIQVTLQTLVILLDLHFRFDIPNL